MTKERFIEVVEKYLADRATEHEQQLAETYLERLEAGAETEPGEIDELVLKAAMWEKIRLQTTRHEALIVPLPWYRRYAGRIIAVAAAVVLIVCITLLVDRNKTAPSIVHRSEKVPNSSLPAYHREINQSGKDKRIALPDGSIVMLADQSEIGYGDLTGNRRDIMLTGKADFKVAKDISKPFTVTSGAVATTALGTQFTVTAYPAKNQVLVRLHEGKVVIRPTDKTDSDFKKPVYLSPGEEFVYAPPVITVRSFKTKPASTATNEPVTAKDHPLIPRNSAGTWYMFNNQQLDGVFDQLAAFYNVQILYDKKDIEHIYFTAKYNKSESLATILDRIATINKLTITKNDTAFIVSK